MVYGTVLAMASLAAGALAHLGPRELIGVVATTSGVIWLAFGVGFVALAAQGARYARVERLSAGGLAAVIALNLALGGVVVVLKVLVSH